jgi:protein-disulfide isomerase
MRAAEAAEAAAAQGKFWEMHDQLFTHQHALQDNDLVRYAKHIGLDLERFSRDLAENTFYRQIEADYERSLFDEHVTGTPTLYLNEVRYTGFTDNASLLAAIELADTTGQTKVSERAGRTGRIGGILARLRHRG